MVNKVKNLLKNKAVLFTVLSAISSGINFLTLIIFGRVFPVEEYAIITSLQAFVSNVAVFMTPLQIMICKSISADKNAKKEVNGYIAMALLISALECALFLVVSIPVMRYLHLVSVIEYVLFILLVILNNMYTIVIGIAQGRQSFILLGITSLMLYAVKMVFGVLLGIMGIGPVAVIIAFAIAEVICISLIIYRTAALFKGKNIGISIMGWKDLDDYLWVFFLYMIVSLYMNNGDILLGNLYCSQKEIGLYSVAINLAKISVFLIATPIATTLLPKVVACNGDSKRQHKLLVLAEIVTFGVSLAYGIFFFVVSGWIIPLLYGSDYYGATAYVLPCVVFSVVLGMFWVFYQYAVATNILKPFTILTASIGLVLVVTAILIRPDLNAIPIIMIAAMVISVLGVLLLMRIRSIQSK